MRTIARVKPHAVDWSATDRDFVLGRIYDLVPCTQMVVLRRLVVDVRNDAVELGAKRVVRRDIRDATGLEHANILRHAVRAARDVVERAVVLRICSTSRADVSKLSLNWDSPAADSRVQYAVELTQRACGGVGSDAGVACRAEDITGAFGSGQGDEGGEDEHRCDPRQPTLAASESPHAAARGAARRARACARRRG